HPALFGEDRTRPVDSEAALRAAECLPLREQRRGGGRGGRLVWRGGFVYPRAHRIPWTRVLCLDGFCGAGQHWGSIRQPKTPAARVGWRRRVSDDRHGT